MTFLLTLIFLALGSPLLESPPDPPPLTAAATRIAADLDHLTNYPTRHTLSPHADAASLWIADRFRSLGFHPVHREPFSYRNRTAHNVVAERAGTDPHAPLILVGAHYDSRMERLGDTDAPAPGADDNASGTAALLEIARALRESPTRHTIRFVAFSGEEQGLVGSRAHADLCRRQGTRIALMLNLDMVGHPSDPDRRAIIVEHDSGLRDPSNDDTSRAWAARLASAARRSGFLVREGPLYGSDYLPFEALGFPCIGLFDGADREPFYHTGDDLRAGVDPTYCARAALAVVDFLRLNFPPTR